MDPCPSLVRTAQRLIGCGTFAVGQLHAGHVRLAPSARAGVFPSAVQIGIFNAACIAYCGVC